MGEATLWNTRLFPIWGRPKVSLGWVTIHFIYYSFLQHFLIILKLQVPHFPNFEWHGSAFQVVHIHLYNPFWILVLCSMVYASLFIEVSMFAEAFCWFSADCAPFFLNKKLVTGGFCCWNVWLEWVVFFCITGRESNRGGNEYKRQC
jgi:hypothetical protein